MSVETLEQEVRSPLPENEQQLSPTSASIAEKAAENSLLNYEIVEGQRPDVPQVIIGYEADLQAQPKTWETDTAEARQEIAETLGNELFGWLGKNEKLRGLFENGNPAQWQVLRSDQNVTHVLNFSPRELSEEDLALIKGAYEKTAEITTGASSLATRAIVVVDQEVLGHNPHEDRPANGASNSRSGVVMISSRVFDDADVSTKEYVRNSEYPQAFAVLAHELTHQAQLGLYSPLNKNRYNHLQKFKERTNWVEKIYETEKGPYIISGIGNAALEGGGLELPVSDYGYAAPSEDTAESGAALAIGVNPGEARTNSFEDMRDAMLELNPDARSLKYELSERGLGDLGSNPLDYPKKPIPVSVRFEPFVGD